MNQLPPLPDDVQRLLEQASPPPMPDDFADKVMARALPTAAAAGAVAAKTVAVAKSVLVVGGLALLGAGAAGGYLAARATMPSSAPSTVKTHLEPVAPTVVAPVAPESPAPAPTAAPTATPAPRRVADETPRSQRDTELSAERAALEVARTALSRGDGPGALEALRAHEARFARGRLVEEREALYVQVLAQAGRLDEARARASAFRAKYPDSLLLPVVDAAVHDEQ